MDKIKLAHGAIRISLEDKKTGERTTLWEGDNAVTQFGKELFLSTSAAMRMNYPLGIGAGSRLPVTTFGSYGTSYYQNVSGSGLACYLLNLDDTTKNGLTPASHTLSVLDKMSINEDTLTGFGVEARTSSSAKEGVITIPDADLVCNPAVSARAWKFPAGISSGTFNAIQIGASLGLNTTSPSIQRGGVIWSGMSENDRVIADNVTAEGYYLRPGIKKNGQVITTDTEILMGDATENKKSRIVYDFVKGTRTVLATDDIRYDLDLGYPKYPQYVVGDYLIMISGTNAYPVRIKMSDWTSTTFYSNNPTGYSLFVKDGYLYFPQSTSLYAYNIETASRDTSKTISYSSLNIPSSLVGTQNFGYVHVQNWGNPDSGKYFVILKKSDYLSVGVVCTDYSDVEGTALDLIPRCNDCCNVQIGDEVYLMTSNLQGQPDLYYTNTINQQNFYMGYGLWFSKTWGSLISYRVLDSAITKDADKEIIVNYWYEFA